MSDPVSEYTEQNTSTRAVGVSPKCVTVIVLSEIEK